MTIKAGVLVVSDRVSRGEEQDKSGEAAVEALQDFCDVVCQEVVSDDYAEIRTQLLELCAGEVDVIITSGGTGLSPRDVTPEATRSVIEREAPGIAYSLLFNGLIDTPRAMLSRAVSGVRGQTLIINLPGSPSAVRHGIEYLQDVLPHAVEVIKGVPEPYEGGTV